MKLSTIILAYQASALLKQAIDSVSFSDETIILWDTNSINPPPKPSTKTKLLKHPLTSFANQRNFALKKARGDWILFLDSDEELTPKLVGQIQQVIQQDDKINGYLIPRHDIFYKQKIGHGEAGDIKLLRLARRNTGRFTRSVHEIWKIKGQIGSLTAPILHHRQNLTTPFIDRMIKYSPLDAKELKKEHKPFTYWRVLLYPLAKFIRNYLLKLGLLDGLLGFLHAYLMSVQSLTVRVYQWENLNQDGSTKSRTKN